MARFTPDRCVGSRSPGRMFYRIWKSMRAFVEARLEARFKELDLSYTQWLAMKAVKDGVVSNAGELARELEITTGATTRLVDSLEEHGLLERDRTSSDRRVVKLALTALGVEVTAALRVDIVEAWNALFEDLDQDEAETFVETLAKLYVKAEQLAGARETVA